MKSKNIILVSSLFVGALVLLLSLKAESTLSIDKVGIQERYVELKIEDTNDEKIKYNVYALSPEGEPVVLLKNSDYKNEFLTLKIPSNANYFMIQRIEGGRKKRELFKINPLRTVVTFGDIAGRIGAD